MKSLIRALTEMLLPPLYRDCVTNFNYLHLKVCDVVQVTTIEQVQALTGTSTNLQKLVLVPQDPQFTI